jgi:hypothetical protein
MKGKLLTLLAAAAVAVPALLAAPVSAAAPTYTCTRGALTVYSIQPKDRHSFVRSGYTCTRDA